MLRKHGSDVVRVRHETDAFLAAVLKNPETASKTAAALEKEFKSLDVQECGLLGAREFEGAMQRSGLGVSSEKVSIAKERNTIEIGEIGVTVSGNCKARNLFKLVVRCDVLLKFWTLHFNSINKFGAFLFNVVRRATTN